MHFNPRSPHGERPKRRRKSAQAKSFQSTLPARGATCAPGSTPRPARNFNPRSPHGERHERIEKNENLQAISIHAPRTGSDCWAATCRGTPAHFNPRSPHGERLRSAFMVVSLVIFQSTLPARGATVARQVKHAVAQFQSTLPARGATFGCRFQSCQAPHFNPRSPHGERLLRRQPQTDGVLLISIHAPRTGSDFFLPRLRPA